ncbi:hypothetical protein GPL13_21285, partial [Bacteroides xylanisolvens]|nr:hypothetical protein [Bacteroides xylanisolvens]
MEDIKPIDKFTLDKYVREVIRVKKEIEDRTETNETEVATKQQATEQQAAEEETKYVFMGTTVTQEFKKRYNAKVLNAHYTFEKYIQYKDIQNTLEALNIDREKF